MSAAVQQEIDLPHDTQWCQRWRERTPTWRPTSEGGFDPSAYRVVQVAEAPAKRFVIKHHYSASWPAVRLAYALQRVDQPPGPGEPDGGRLVGVVALGIPMNSAVLDVFPGLQHFRESLELSRLVLLDECESNAESWTCARVFTAAAKIGVRGIVAHADPVGRTRMTPDGPVLISPGHIGHVYGHAQGFAYLGRTRARRLTVLPDATVLSDRAASKLRRNERGYKGVETRLRALGAPARRADEPGAAYLSRALEAIGATTIHHGGNHRYARTIGPGRTRIQLTGTRYPAPVKADT